MTLSGPKPDIPFNHDVELPAIVRCMLSAAVVMPETQSNMSCVEPRISAVEIAKIQSYTLIQIIKSPWIFIIDKVER